MSSSTCLPPCNRYITTHTAAGKSIFHSSPPQFYHTRPPSSKNPTPPIKLARSYAVSNVPAELANDTDVQQYLSEDPKTEPTSHKAADIVVSNGTGANLVVVDLEPGAVSMMHQTVSIDYSICVIGRIEMELDSGQVVRFRPGDHVIQRGTMHKWYNASKTEPARFVAVSLPCVPFDIGGKMLNEVHLKGTATPKVEDSRL